MTKVARIALPLGALAAVVACGPSYQALYEGDARFEHCYALEETAATMSTRSECWRDWTLRYTYGQTRDRVEYAAARYRALSRAPQAPTDEAMMEAAPGEGRAASVVATPAPTSAFAPPPKTLEESDADASTGLPGYADAGQHPVVVTEETASSPSGKPPGAECTTTCDFTWSGCKSKCTGKCDACARAYKRCMVTCLSK